MTPTGCVPSGLPPATYREMLATLNHVSTKAWAQAIDKDLPVLLIAGDCDPVGDYGKRRPQGLGHAGRRRCQGSDLPDF